MILKFKMAALDIKIERSITKFRTKYFKGLYTIISRDIPWKNRGKPNLQRYPVDLCVSAKIME